MYMIIEKLLSTFLPLVPLSLNSEQNFFLLIYYLNKLVITRINIPAYSSIGSSENRQQISAPDPALASWPGILPLP